MCTPKSYRGFESLSLRQTRTLAQAPILNETKKARGFEPSVLPNSRVRQNYFSNFARRAKGPELSLSLRQTQKTVQAPKTKEVQMGRGRLEAFSDGVIAIIITVMVLELKIPHHTNLSALLTLRYTFLCYLLSFVYLAIYWTNHHHLFQTVKDVTGGILWANIHLLFWLSLIPFVTAWAGQNSFANVPTALYGFVLFMAACAYYILTREIIAIHGYHSLLAKAIGKDFKGKLSVVFYATAIPLALWMPILAMIIYFAIAIIWIIPDSRIESKMHQGHKHH